MITYEIVGMFYDLHSTMVLFKYNLDIEICQQASFTFHYGPIQIIILIIRISFLILFTFHYGPIQIKIVEKSCIFK